jgi:hypothetical protein
MTDSIEDLERRRDLLKEIAELSSALPDEDEMEAVSDYVSNLKAIPELEERSGVDEDTMRAVDDYVGNLGTIPELEERFHPGEDAMKEVADYVANLGQIENVA